MPRPRPIPTPSWLSDLEARFKSDFTLGLDPATIDLVPPSLGSGHESAKDDDVNPRSIGSMKPIDPALKSEARADESITFALAHGICVGPGPVGELLHRCLQLF